MKNYIYIAIVVLTFTGISLSFGQVSYYVATTGSDTSAGTEDHPWKTFQKAFNSATPGSTVYFKQGVYNEKTTMNVSGTAEGGFITFRNYGTDTVVLDGTGKTGDQLILIEDKSYIRLIGFELRNNLNQTFGTGIWVKGGGSHLEFRKNTIHDMRRISNGDCMALSVYGTSNTPLSYIVIDSNLIYNCEPGHSEAMPLNGNVDTFWVTNNIVHDVNNIGIVMIGGEATCPTPALDAARNGICSGNIVYNARSLYGGGYAGGIYVDGGSNITVENNISYQNDVGIEIGCENQGVVASGNIVRNNLVFNNDKRGIGVGGYDYPATGKVTNASILNNTVFNNDTYNTGAGELTIEYTENCVFKNNIFYSTTSNRLLETIVGNSSGNIFDYNVWYAPGGASSATVDYNGAVYTGFENYRSGTGQDAHSTFGNPLFVSPSLPLPDLHIQTGSPAIDTGDPAFLPESGETDKDGNVRLSGVRVDCGAYEKNQLAFTVPELISPVDDTSFTAGTIDLIWHVSDSGATYQLQVAKDSLFTIFTVNDSMLVDTMKEIVNSQGGTYYWRVRAKVTSINSAWSPIWKFTYINVNHWKLVSVPTEEIDRRKSTLFPTAISNAFRYVPGTGYVTSDSLENGAGYWVKFGEDESTNFTGSTISVDTIDVSAGWNLIGSISNAVNVEVVTTEPTDLLASSFFGYQKGYGSVSSIEPGNGYWIKLKQSGKLILNSSLYHRFGR